MHYVEYQEDGVWHTFRRRKHLEAAQAMVEQMELVDPGHSWRVRPQANYEDMHCETCTCEIRR